MLSTQKLCVTGAVLAALAVTGCGSSSSSSSGSAAPATSSTGASSASSSSSAGASAGSGGGAGALSADAHSTATGDIPDNQIFLVFQNNHAGYSMKYPEGWTQLGSGSSVTFKNKNNLVHVTISRGPTPTPASVTAQLQALKSSAPTLAFSPPKTVTLGASTAVKSVYTTQSAPNPVTGKRVLLIVDRYALSHSGRLAVVDLGTQKGVDNVDAYRKMIESFRWR